jgi:hypothetical protein
MARIRPSATGTLHRQLVEACKRAGAVEFCQACYAWVLPGHSVHRATKPFKPTQARLEGGLEYVSDH